MVYLHDKDECGDHLILLKQFEGDSGGVLDSIDERDDLDIHEERTEPGSPLFPSIPLVGSGCSTSGISTTVLLNIASK